MKLANIRTFRTRHFIVTVDALTEDDTDLSWDETGETARMLENGDLITFCALARVYFNGEAIGEDYLGGCIYKNFESFMDHRECGLTNREFERQGERGRCGSYFADMIARAIAEARKFVADIPKLRAA